MREITMTPAEVLAACAKFEQMAAAEVPFAECMEAAIGAALATIAANRHDALATLDSAIECCSRSPRPCEKARAAVAALVAERDAAMGNLHDEIAANLAFREAGGAKPDEDMPTFCARLIAERDALRNGPSDVDCLTIYNAVSRDGLTRDIKTTAHKIATVRAALAGAGQ